MTAKERLVKRIGRTEKKLLSAEKAFKRAEVKLLEARNVKNALGFKLQRLKDTLPLIPEDENERRIVETTVKEMDFTSGKIVTALHTHPSGQTISWWFRVEPAVFLELRLDDKIRLEYRFAPRRKDKWEPVILPVAGRDEIHLSTDYDS
jgi:hypothetical protein